MKSSLAWMATILSEALKLLVTEDTVLLATASF